jgi:hypothetical protein
MRCLAPDPAGRPASALAVAAALPGGDPLAAALAAGETPSPEMVAAAGEEGVLSRRAGVALVGSIVVTLLAGAWLADRTLLVGRVPLDAPGKSWSWRGTRRRSPTPPAAWPSTPNSSRG